MAQFIGRKNELQQLEKELNASKNKMGVLFGRRRVGKTRLLEEFAKNKKNVLFFEAEEDLSQKDQIRHFQIELADKRQDPQILRVDYINWDQFLTKLTDIFTENKKTKFVLILDELQWMAGGKTQLISKLKHYWDKKWADCSVLLILCGSVASFMVENVIRSKALYGRVDFEIALAPLNPDEAHQLLGSRRSAIEVLTYQLILGRIPKYYEWIDVQKPLDWNINELCFTSSGILVKDFEKTFYKQFKNGSHYNHIVDLLAESPCTQKEISEKLNLPSGGGLKLYLDNLAYSKIIRPQTSLDRPVNSKLKRYVLIDEYLCFYKKYIVPNRNVIENNTSGRQLFDRLVKPHWKPWLGFAFERFCLNNAEYLAKRMSISDRILNFGPFFNKALGVQIDLLYKTHDKSLILCEMKFSEKKIGVDIISEIERKKEILKTHFSEYSIETALVSIHGPSQGLKIEKYFDHILTIADLI